VRAALAAGLALLLAPPLAARADDELGRKVFTEVAQPPCKLCHTLQAAGATATVGPSLDELKPDKARVLEVVRKGLGPMPPFAEKLTAEQIEAVSAYVAKSAGQ
jgi:mono/diheme cytochrome c family protein